MSTPTSLTDGVIALRALRADDAPAMYAAVRESIPDLKPWMSWAHDDYLPQETRDWITVAGARWVQGDYFGFAIVEAQSGAFLGGLSLSQIHSIYHFCNLGYWIRSTQRGHGYAGRATRLGARFAFERLKLVRVEIVIAVQNEASVKAADKSGAHREGILHNRMLVGAQVSDAIMYSLLPSDFGLAARV